MASPNATAKRIFFTRHAQAEHNVAEDYSIPDAPLTELGREQSLELNELTKETFQRTAELLVTSPLRRPMETMLLGFPSLQKRLEESGKPVILLDLLQEVNAFPCDTPLYPVSVLANSNSGIFSRLDFSTLSEKYASKTGIFAPDRAAERAREVRRWLRARSEREIVVIAHGDILRYIVDGENSHMPWLNTETKIYIFTADDDDDAALVLVDDLQTSDATEGPTSSEMV